MLDEPGVQRVLRRLVRVRRGVPALFKQLVQLELPIHAEGLESRGRPFQPARDRCAELFLDRGDLRRVPWAVPDVLREQQSEGKEVVGGKGVGAETGNGDPREAHGSRDDD